MSDDMITMQMAISTSTIEDAPNYGTDTKLLRVDEAIIVKNGTIKGYPTIDLQMKDQAGNKYVVMASGRLFEMLGSAIEGTRKNGMN